MSDIQREKQQRFLSLAGEYCGSAETLFNASEPNAPTILVSWQTAENSLKALLGEDMHTHDLSRIVGRLQRDNILTSDEIIQLSAHGAAITGSRTYNDTRYPDNDPNYWRSQSREAIAAAVTGARYFFDFAAKKIASMNASGSPSKRSEG